MRQNVGEPCGFKPDADDQWFARYGGQCPVKKSTAISQPIARLIKPDQRRQQHMNANLICAMRLWDAGKAWDHFG